MAKSVPPLKTSSSARAKNGEAKEFSDSKIKGAKTVETSHPAHLRSGFTRKVYSTPCGKGGFPKG